MACQESIDQALKKRSAMLQEQKGLIQELLGPDELSFVNICYEMRAMNADLTHYRAIKNPDHVAVKHILRLEEVIATLKECLPSTARSNASILADIKTKEDEAAALETKTYVDSKGQKLTWLSCDAGYATKLDADWRRIRTIKTIEIPILRAELQLARQD